MKYKCSICGYICDDISGIGVCPTCGAPTDLFEEDKDIEEDYTPSNAVKISKDNAAIERILDKCINCGMCTQTCLLKEGMMFDENSDLCVNCGQCVVYCPTKALIPKSSYKEFIEAKKQGKICIAYTSPSVRVSVAEIFNLNPGTIEISKMVGLLKYLGFDYIFDTTFGADLTIMEEASELVDRIKNNKPLPMFTSCCPAWVKYAEQFYPELLDNISTCKSPIGMMGPVVQEYFTRENNISKDDIFTVAITPCTAKKFEIKREEIWGTDLVITVNELNNIVKQEKIKYEDIKESEFDSFFKEGSGAGTIFGNTGGVMEAALRTASYLIMGKSLENIVFEPVRGYDNVREAEIIIDDIKLNVCVIHKMSSAKEILDEVKNGTSKYHFIEIMNCEGGCIGGGGQIISDITDEVNIKKTKISNLYKRDNSVGARCSHDNPQIKEIYDKFLEYPLSKKSHELLHTTYVNRKTKDLVNN